MDIATTTRAGVGWALGLPLLRVALVAAASLATWLVVGATAGWTAFPPVPLLSTVAMAPVNIACLVLVYRLVRREGGTLGELIGYRRGRLVRDILWGVLWFVVLNVPFTLTVMGVMWLLHGADMFDRFDTMYFDPAAVPVMTPAAYTVLAVVAVVTFAPLNAPAEELVYRGYAQRGLARRMPVPIAILLSAVVFGAQHLFYAPTPGAMLIHACAFVVWGAIAGIIVYRQGRLLPVIVAHFLVNLLTSAPALAFIAAS